MRIIQCNKSLIKLVTLPIILCFLLIYLKGDVIKIFFSFAKLSRNQQVSKAFHQFYLEPNRLSVLDTSNYDYSFYSNPNDSDYFCKIISKTDSTEIFYIYTGKTDFSYFLKEQ